MGPILPQLPVYGKELGISSVVMGIATGILPIVFLLAKPAFGLIVDIYRNFRKTIFMLLIVFMVVCFALIGLIPPEPKLDIFIHGSDEVTLNSCNETDIINEQDCYSNTTRVICNSGCFTKSATFLLNYVETTNSSLQYKLCHLQNDTMGGKINNTFSCDIRCTEDMENSNNCFYKSLTFWSFIILMSLGSIGFNVVNSISDAICFDVIGDDFDYGKQRVWGAIGFGIFALLAGFAVDSFSGSSITYIPALALMLICAVFDMVACAKLKLPVMEAPENIFKDLRTLMKDRNVVIFITFAVFAGILDSFIIYYLFWYLEDLAETTQTTNIKLLEGLIVAAETLGGEVIFFSVSGSILERFGHVHCFSMCFINYALRLGLISIVPSPWWIVPIEFVFQGPTYALTYTTIVAYANELAPPGASATMQGIAAGMDDGFGFAVGSFIGGVLYKYIGGRYTMQNTRRVHLE
ncbi:hypothetical protein JTB14_008457 [Gonioctena quinquepunctata]|nr:hypothetical protein JTB14_008457 [Gonioctena quinquepunctata]